MIHSSPVSKNPIMSIPRAWSKRMTRIPAKITMLPVLISLVLLQVFLPAQAFALDTFVSPPVATGSALFSLASITSLSRSQLLSAVCCPNNCTCGTRGCRSCGGFRSFSNSASSNRLLDKVADFTMQLKARVNAALHGGPPSPA